jgi:hypothetical protein
VLHGAEHRLKMHLFSRRGTMKKNEKNSEGQFFLSFDQPF